MHICAKKGAIYNTIISIKQVHNVSLYRCSTCDIFFKSKKGYDGHNSSRHSPKLVGTDGKPKSKKEVEGINKVSMMKQISRSLQLHAFNFINFITIIKGTKYLSYFRS